MIVQVLVVRDRAVQLVEALYGRRVQELDAVQVRRGSKIGSTTQARRRVVDEDDGEGLEVGPPAVVPAEQVRRLPQVDAAVNGKEPVGVTARRAGGRQPVGRVHDEGDEVPAQEGPPVTGPIEGVGQIIEEVGEPRPVGAGGQGRRAHGTVLGAIRRSRCSRQRRSSAPGRSRCRLEPAVRLADRERAAPLHRSAEQGESKR